MSNIINIQPATRQGAHLLIQLFGGPRCGKTYTALQLARGIAGPTGKIGVIDTESGRAKLYSDKVPGGFFTGDLTPPFTPDRYKLAIEEFVQFGADVLVIDSFSHVWNGPGGVLENADQQEAAGKKGLQKWLRPKVEYRKMVGFLLSTRIHIIFCSRGKQPVEERMVDGRKAMVTLPWEPIQDKQLKYEMTIVLPMIQDGTFEAAPDRLKTPGDLAHLFTGKPLTIETGAAIAAWVAGGSAVNHAHELLRKQANDAAVDGTDAFRAFWAKLSKVDRDVLKIGLENYQSIAKATDDEKASQAGGMSIAQVGGETPGEPTRIPVGLNSDMTTDWPGWVTTATTAIEAAPSADWLTAWCALHQAAMANLGKEAPDLQGRIIAAIDAKRETLKQAA
jgi:hypothetical protein